MSAMDFPRPLAACVGLAVLLAGWSAPVAANDSGLAKALHVLRVQGGKICTVEHTHYGESWSYRSKAKARRRAVAVWRGLVIAEYGTDWGNYRRSKARQESCWRSGRRWRCKVESRPCRPR